jgi:hypothetical protein
LTLACSRCNQRRYNFVTGHDRETATIVSLFNPRQQNWRCHYHQAEQQRYSQLKISLVETHLGNALIISNIAKPSLGMSGILVLRQDLILG